MILILLRHRSRARHSFGVALVSIAERRRSQRESVEKERQEERRSGAKPINFLDKDALRGPFFSLLGPKAPRQFHGPFHRAAVFNFSIPAIEAGHDPCAIPRQEIHGCPKDSQNSPTYSWSRSRIYIYIYCSQKLGDICIGYYRWYCKRNLIFFLLKAKKWKSKIKCFFFFIASCSFWNILYFCTYAYLWYIYIYILF